MTRFIVYSRVSTDKQGESGLGLDAQHQTVARFIARMLGAPPDDKENAPALPFGMSRPGGELRPRLCAWHICILQPKGDELIGGDTPGDSSQTFKFDDYYRL